MVHGHRWLIGGLVVVGLAVALALVAPMARDSLAADGIIYVDADATGGNGSSWENAYTDLQTALTAAGSGNEIWIATGTYTPTQEFSPGDARSATFQLKNGVAVYGGFDPDAGVTEWEDRDWETYETILSGDLAGDDGPDFANNEDNSYHVFYHPEGTGLDNTAILDGFTITGGNADGAVFHMFGGGMYNHTSSPTLTNCTFAGNSATFGGGMCNANGSSPVLLNCTFQGNSGFGGGMHNRYNSSPALTNCTFEGNWTSQSGGGMSNNQSSSPVLTNCTFAGNSAAIRGGGMLNDGSSPTLTNCTFQGNSAILNGGGMANYTQSSPTLTNCILWWDTYDEIYNDDPESSPVITYSDIQGGHEGEGNIDAEPLFVDYVAGDLRLQLTSPAIDAGDNDAVPSGITTDLGGHPRFADVHTVPDTGNGDPPLVDMGAYETPPELIFVDLEATGANDGTSWPDAFTDLQDSLAWAEEGVTIWVAAGVYTPTAEYGGTGDHYRSFQLMNGVALYGGFDPSVGDTAFEDRDWQANHTILSGDLEDNDGPGFANNDENSYHVFYHPAGTDLDSSAVLDGFTITGGNANGADPHFYGGGMLNDGSSPTLTNCTFAGNWASNSGGGLANYFSSSPTLTNCTFSGNATGQYGGGGMTNSSSSPALTNCTLSGNSGFLAGGILNLNSSSLALTNCIIWGNTGPEINDIDGSPVVTYSDIQGGYSGEGNIDEDPLFVDAANGDFHLGPDSPCIDAGNNAAPNLPPYDFEGDARIVDGDGDGVPVVDMGVDEVLLRVYLPLVLRGY